VVDAELSGSVVAYIRGASPLYPYAGLDAVAVGHGILHDPDGHVCLVARVLLKAERTAADYPVILSSGRVSGGRTVATRKDRAKRRFEYRDDLPR
jgi:hypothetical protein